MNTGLLAACVAVSALTLVLFLASFVYSRWLSSGGGGGGWFGGSAEEGDVRSPDLLNEHGEIDPVKQIKHLKKLTKEFLIRYEELKFGKVRGRQQQRMRGRPAQPRMLRFGFASCATVLNAVCSSLFLFLFSFLARAVRARCFARTGAAQPSQ